LTNIRVINESTSGVNFVITPADAVAKPYRKAYCCDNGDGKYSLKVFNEDGSDYKTFDNVDVQKACGGISEQCFTKCEPVTITAQFACSAYKAFLKDDEANEQIAKAVSSIEQCLQAKKDSGVIVEIVGQTDDTVGKSDENQTLSEARAVTVATKISTELTKVGIDGSRMYKMFTGSKDFIAIDSCLGDTGNVKNTSIGTSAYTGDFVATSITEAALNLVLDINSLDAGKVLIKVKGIGQQGRGEDKRKVVVKFDK
jgi:hypothetical protein